MAVLRVLMLDAPNSNLGQVLANHDIEAHITDALEGADRLDVYTANTYEIMRDALAAAPDNYDAIIVGNNLGAGLLAIAALPPELHPRTIVVWNDHTFAGEKPYRRIAPELLWFGARLAEYSENGIGILEFLQMVAELQPNT